MNILLIGGGGREHALAWKIAASPLVDRVYCAPGNAGIAREAECMALDCADHGAVIGFCRSKAIDFVVVGPEAPLAAGLVDDLESAGIKTFGPTKAAARLEGSKGFTKDLCRANNIPTAAYERFDAAAPAKEYLRRMAAPIVVKADGLAAGKGVVVAATTAEAEAAVDMMFGGALGEAVSPAPVMTPALERRALEEIVLPTLAAMKAMGAPYKGVLYAGLMITDAGPKLIEYNVRFGDPECQVLMVRLMSDLVPALIAARDGMLGNFALRWYPEVALTVVMAANGYPGDYAKGSVIAGLSEAEKIDGVEIFHAGTRKEDGRILANGGRVLDVTALGKTMAQAQARAYAAVDKIVWPEGFCRRDIGARAAQAEKA